MFSGLFYVTFFLQNCHKLERLDLEECVFVSVLILFNCILCFICKDLSVIEHF